MPQARPFIFGMIAFSFIVSGWCLFLLLKKHSLIPMKVLMCILWWYTLNFYTIVMFAYDAPEIEFYLLNIPLLLVFNFIISFIYSVYYINARKNNPDMKQVLRPIKIFFFNACIIFATFISGSTTHHSIMKLLLSFVS